jgi:uncharacterized small protein (DUF1192 family)
VTRLEIAKEASMDTDDLEPTKEKDEIKDLDVMSIEALGDYITDLELEIERVRGAISLKDAAKSSAESVFEF